MVYSQSAGTRLQIPIQQSVQFPVLNFGMHYLGSSLKTIVNYLFISYASSNTNTKQSYINPCIIPMHHLGNRHDFGKS